MRNTELFPQISSFLKQSKCRVLPAAVRFSVELQNHKKKYIADLTVWWQRAQSRWWLKFIPNVNCCNHNGCNKQRNSPLLLNFPYWCLVTESIGSFPISLETHWEVVPVSKWSFSATRCTSCTYFLFCHYPRFHCVLWTETLVRPENKSLPLNKFFICSFCFCTLN